MSTPQNQLSIEFQSNQSLDVNSITLEQQQRINNLLKSSKATNTITAYQSDWTQFTQFCELNNLVSLPAHPNTILLYLSELSKTHKLSTIKRRLSSINKAHITSDHPSPTTVQTVKELLNGIARTIGNRQTPKKALVLDDIKALIDCIDVSTVSGKRDKALLLIGFTTASRRSELVSIDVQDITFTQQGMDISIYQEKTKSYINKSILCANNDYCPVKTLNEWLTASKIKSNAIFRGVNKVGAIGERLASESVADLVKKYAEKAGLDPSEYAGHSLRSGFATSAAEEGYNTQSIMHQTGHNTHGMVDRYVQQGNRYKNNATAMLSDK